jgi:hypothetical protein
MITEISVPVKVVVLSRIADALDDGLTIPDALDVVAPEMVTGHDNVVGHESAAVLSISVRYKRHGLIFSDCLRDLMLEYERKFCARSRANTKTQANASLSPSEQ